MYNIIRLIICGIFLACSVIAVKKSRVFRKHAFYTAFACLSIILFAVLAFLPFENFFITFDSPKEAYEYYNLGESNIELIVEGKDCDFIVDCKNDSDTYLIVPKTSDGWKIGIGSNAKKIVQTFSNGIALCVYQYKNTDDYFITVLDTNGGESTISDEYNTNFLSTERYNESLGKSFVTYYAHITNLKPQYNVTVNDQILFVSFP